MIFVSDVISGKREKHPSASGTLSNIKFGSLLHSNGENPVVNSKISSYYKELDIKYMPVGNRGIKEHISKSSSLKRELLNKGVIRKLY